MALKQIYHGTPEYEQMVKLRYDIMRKPLGLEFSADELAKEKSDILIGAFEDDELIGCCILSQLDSQCTRLRQMAVQKNRQGMGFGESMMHFAENLARDRGYKVIMMHARESALGFYEKLGYRVKGDAFTEVNLPHRMMEKEL